MLLMALDHTRDFFGPSGMNVRNVEKPALFLTRWVTHFCALDDGGAVGVCEVPHPAAFAQFRPGDVGQ